MLFYKALNSLLVFNVNVDLSAEKNSMKETHEVLLFQMSPLNNNNNKN